MTTKNALKTAFLLGLLSALLLVGGRAIAGRQGLYIGLTMAILMNIGIFVLVLIVYLFASHDPRMLPVFAGGAALIAFVVARFGLLATVVYCTTLFLFLTNTLPTRPEWYTLRGLVAPALLVALAAWAFHTSLGGRPVWRIARLKNELLDGV